MISKLLFKRRNGFEKLNEGGVATGNCPSRSLKLAVVRFDILLIILLVNCSLFPVSISSTCTIYNKVCV